MNDPIPSVAPSPKKRSRRWLLEAGVVGVAYAGVTQFQTSGLLANGSVAPTFVTTDLNGKQVMLDDYRGRPLVLHFWATWCGVCRSEFGMLNTFEHKYGGLLALVAEEPSDAVRSFVRRHDLRYPVAYASEELIRAYGVSAYPSTYYLTKDHEVSSATVGMSTSVAMRARAYLAS
jgi:thiol-disulfide isomerase/thioredoxin